jgi:hypothetical protein
MKNLTATIIAIGLLSLSGCSDNLDQASMWPSKPPISCVAKADASGFNCR